MKIVRYREIRTYEMEVSDSFKPSDSVDPRLSHLTHRHFLIDGVMEYERDPPPRPGAN